MRQKHCRRSFNWLRTGWENEKEREDTKNAGGWQKTEDDLKGNVKGAGS